MLKKLIEGTPNGAIDLCLVLLFDTAEYEIVPNQCGTIPSYEGIWECPAGKNTLI